MEESMIAEEILKDQFQNLDQQTIQVKELPEKSQDFLNDHKLIKKQNRNKTKQNKNTTTRIKSRNFLSNIVYAGVNNKDIVDKNFCFDTYVLITKNINRFLLERKISDQPKHEMIYLLWKECMPVDFFNFIYKKENFSYLNSKNVLDPKVSDIVWKFIKEDENNF